MANKKRGGIGLGGYVILAAIAYVTLNQVFPEMFKSVDILEWLTSLFSAD